jgi:hypothetical protein
MKRFPWLPTLLLPALAIPLLAVGLAGLPAQAVAEEGATEGKGVFLGARCNMCHSIASHEIEATTQSERMRGPDLSDVGNRHEGEWIKAFLKKEVEREGKKHGRDFRGTEEELGTLVAWLSTLRQEE